MEAVAVARRRLPPGGVVPRGLRVSRRRRRRRPDRGAAVGAVRAGQGLARDLQLHVPARSGRRPPGPAAGRPRCCRWRKARARRAPRCSTSSTAPPSTPPSTSTSRSPRRRRSSASSPSPPSAAGGTCGCCPRPAPPITATTSAETADGMQQPMLNVFHRDGDTIRHFWGSELFYAPAIPGKDPATSALSSRSGTSSTSPRKDADRLG